MKRGRSISISRILLAFAIALAVTLLSSRIQRRGPEQVQYGNLCGPAMDEPCYRPVLKGGFPAAYLFDAPGVSREDRLAFVEDHFRPLPFALDAALYFVLAAGAMEYLVRRRRAIEGRL